MNPRRDLEYPGANLRTIAKAILLLSLATQQLLAPVRARAATTTGDPYTPPTW